MTLGVLALQGDFEAHQRALAGLGVSTLQVRSASELAEVDGLVMPGGESTTMLKLMTAEGLFEPLREFALHKPTFGTCAGVILLAAETLSPSQASLGALDVTVERNAYGRQIDSSIRKVLPAAAFEQAVGEGELEAVFIRAPIIRRTGPDVEVLASDGDTPVLVRQGHILAASFHPELTSDRRVHRYFVDMVARPR
ncbi:MAG: pyridoxal 5'-phosphate synthase glutaminase subunit PdxT [Bryobacterales bacterium]